MRSTNPGPSPGTSASTAVRTSGCRCRAVQIPETAESLTLEWSQSQRIRSVRLVFDDDTDVELNTLHHHRTPDRIFPELVRDYLLEVREGGAWREIVRVGANRRRQRVHETSADDVRALRLRVLATNGAPQARVVSIRVY